MCVKTSKDKHSYPQSVKINSQNRPADISEVAAGIDLIAWAGRAGVKLKRIGNRYQGLCPFHRERSPSFFVFTDGTRPGFKCFGCGEHGDGIDFVQKIYGVDARDALRMITGREGAGDCANDRRNAAEFSLRRPGRGGAGSSSVSYDSRRQNAIDRARDLWRRAEPAHGTKVMTYLRSRGINTDVVGVPPTIRYLETDYWHMREGAERPYCLGRLPAMVAAIQSPDGGVTGVHVTYLNDDGTGKAKLNDPDHDGRILPSKKIKGVVSNGAENGGAIRLSPAGIHMGLVEGIETGLSVMQMMRMQGRIEHIWVAISITNQCQIALPPVARDVTVWADNDMKPPRDNQKDPKELIYDAARRLRGQGVRPRIVWADKGMDFNDMLAGGHLL